MSSKLTEAQIHDKFAEIVAESLRIDRDMVLLAVLPSRNWRP